MSFFYWKVIKRDTRGARDVTGKIFWKLFPGKNFCKCGTDRSFPGMVPIFLY